LGFELVLSFTVLRLGLSGESGTGESGEKHFEVMNGNSEGDGVGDEGLRPEWRRIG